MNKLFKWILITIIIIEFAIEIVIVYNSISVQKKMNDMIEMIDAEGTVSESVKNDTLNAWLEMHYYGENGVRIKCETMNIDTTLKQSIYFNVDNTHKKIYFMKEDTITF